MAGDSFHRHLRTMPEWRGFELPVGHNVIAAAFDALLEIPFQTSTATAGEI